MMEGWIMKNQEIKNEKAKGQNQDVLEKISGDKVVIDKEYCKGCALCVAYCPHGVLEMSEDINSSGYHYSVFKNKEKCTSCTYCAIVCPDACIEVYK